MMTAIKEYKIRKDKMVTAIKHTKQDEDGHNKATTKLNTGIQLVNVKNTGTVQIRRINYSRSDNEDSDQLIKHVH